jgi:hypothetical protein
VNAQSSSLPVPPPYALSTPVFRLRALASLAARAPIGGPREIALATFLIARLVDDCRPEKELPPAARGERSAGARGWLANIALPTPVRASLTKLADATSGDLSDIGPALTNVMSVANPYLDAAARTELDRLAHAFAK